MTVDNQTHELARPFLVIATQNPIEYEGTYPLPGGAARPFHGAAGARLSGRRRRGRDARRPRRARPGPRCGGGRRRVDRARRAGRRRRPCTASEALRRYVVALCEATRTDPRAVLGASPRAALLLFRAAKALAALEGRDHALPDDVQALAPSVLKHRLLLAPGATDDDRETVVRERAGAGSGALTADDDGGALDARPRGGVRAVWRRLRLAVALRTRGGAGGPRRRVANLGAAGGATGAAGAAARPVEHRRGRAVWAWNPHPLGAPAPARRARRSSAGRRPRAARDAPWACPARAAAPCGAAAGASSPPPCCSATRCRSTRPRSAATPARGSWSCRGSSRSSDATRRGGPGDAALDGPRGPVRNGARHQDDRLRDRRVASVPQRQPGVAHPLGDRGPHRRDGGAPAGRRRRLARRSWCWTGSIRPIRTPSTPPVRAAASICVHLAPAGGCTLLVSGERRRAGGRLAAQGVARRPRPPGRGRGRQRRARDSAPVAGRDDLLGDRGRGRAQLDAGAWPGTAGTWSRPSPPRPGAGVHGRGLPRTAPRSRPAGTIGGGVSQASAAAAGRGGSLRPWPAAMGEPRRTTRLAATRLDRAAAGRLRGARRVRRDPVDRSGRRSPDRPGSARRGSRSSPAPPRSH